jgi:hypothetical protein
MQQALGVSGIAEALGIDEPSGDGKLQNFDFRIVNTSAVKGVGIPEAFTWLTDRLKAVGK